MNILNQPLDSIYITNPTTPTNLTEEQKEIVEHTPQPGSIAKVIAYAGTGKTSTFLAYAAERPSTAMTYLAFNKSVEQEAKERFGSNVLVKTIHALAYSVIGKRYRNITGNIQNWLIAKETRLPLYEATLVAKTLETYLNSAEDDIEAKHVEPDHLNRCGGGYEDRVISAAKEVWLAVQNESHGFSMTHNGYLKLYQLSRPSIHGDTILLDEAQDTNPVTEALVLHQLTLGKSVLMCGDPYQQIYAWRGAEDALARHECRTFRLTQSFRFGAEIASVANKILSAFHGETVPLVGMKEYEAEPTASYTKVCRTNSEIFSSTAKLNAPFCVVGREAFFGLMADVKDIFNIYRGRTNLVNAARLRRFKDFQSLTSFAEETLDQELGGKCAIVTNYSNDIPAIIERLTKNYKPSSSLDWPTYVTCHKAKGLEWDYVRVAEDFEDIYDDEGKLLPIGDALAKDEANLLYVAVTRAKKQVQLNHNLKRLCQTPTNEL